MAEDSFDDLVQKHLELIDESPERLSNSVIKAERAIWEQIEEKISKLQTKDGVILANKANVAIVTELLNELQKALNRPEYIKAVELFIKDFNVATELTDKIAQKVEASFKPDQVQKDLLRQSQFQTIKILTGDSAFGRVSQPFVQVLTSAIASRAPYAETVKQLRTVIQGDKTTDGRLLANVKTVASTSLAVADRTYSTQTANAINAEWFKYVGRSIKTSRDFCEKRANLYFHKKEIQDWAEEEWNGQIEGTNSRTIFNFAGGWNCRHVIQFVSILLVPKDVVARNIANGNYVERD